MGWNISRSVLNIFYPDISSVCLYLLMDWSLPPTLSSDADHWKSLCRPWVPPQDSRLWPECWQVCGEVPPWRLSTSFLSTDCGLLWPHTRQPVSTCCYCNVYTAYTLFIYLLGQYCFLITWTRQNQKMCNSCVAKIKKPMGIMVFITFSNGCVRNVSAFSLTESQLFDFCESSGGKKTTTFRSRPACTDCFLMFFSQPCQSGFNLKPFCVPSLLLSSPSPPFQKLEDWFEALSLNQELGIPLPAELDELHQRLSSLHWPKDGSPSQSTDQSSTPTAACPDSSSMTDNGT